jgi:oxygen-independent coproporphyrinogen-3 oxidase
VAENEHVGVAEEQSEVMMLGLRLNEGVSEAEFVRRFGVTLESVFGKEVKPLTALGLLEERRGYIRLTERGRLLGNEAFAEFV